MPSDTDSRECEADLDLQGLKAASHSRDDALRLPVTLGDGRHIGALVLVGAWLLGDTALLTDMTAWRGRNMRMFLSHFEPSVERTAAYVGEQVLARSDRVLFLVEDECGAIRGHMGVTDCVADVAELDNFIRGAGGGHPQLMPRAEHCLIRWLFGQGVQQVRARVMSYNWMAQALHEGLGFTCVSRQPLRKVETPGGWIHEVVEEAASNVPYHCVVLQMSAPLPP